MAYKSYTRYVTELLKGLRRVTHILGVIYHDIFLNIINIVFQVYNANIRNKTYSQNVTRSKVMAQNVTFRPNITLQMHVTFELDSTTGRTPNDQLKDVRACNMQRNMVEETMSHIKYTPSISSLELFKTQLHSLTPEQHSQDFPTAPSPLHRPHLSISNEKQILYI